MIKLPSGREVSRSFLERLRDGFLNKKDFDDMANWDPRDLRYIFSEWVTEVQQ